MRRHQHQSPVSTRHPTSDNMKFFKIFKKKPPPSPSSPNLICNIHWAEVQRELSQDIMKDPLVIRSGNGAVNNINAVRLQNSIGWNSAEDDNFSSEANSWSSISLSSSSKSNDVQENLQEENFSRYVKYFAIPLYLTRQNLTTTNSCGDPSISNNYFKVYISRIA